MLQSNIFYEAIRHIRLHTYFAIIFTAFLLKLD